MQNTIPSPRRQPIGDVLIFLAVGLASALCAVAVATGGVVQPFAPPSGTASLPHGAQTVAPVHVAAPVSWPKRGALAVQRALAAVLARRNSQGASAVRRRPPQREFLLQ
jgi:hypothetical protein